MRKLTKLLLGTIASLSLASCDLSSMMGGFSFPGIEEAASSYLANMEESSSEEESSNEHFEESSSEEESSNEYIEGSNFIHSGSSTDSNHTAPDSLSSKEEQVLMKLYNAYLDNGGHLSFGEWIMTIQRIEEFGIVWAGYNQNGDIVIEYKDGHQEIIEHNWIYDRTISEGGCGSPKEILYKCNDCGFYKIFEIESSQSHQYALLEEIAGTCQTSGKRRYVCENCGEIYVENTGRTEHEFVEDMSTNTATCTRSGTVTAQCVNCGLVSVEQSSPLGHTYVVDQDSVEGGFSCNYIGTYSETCSACGQTREVTTTTASGHDYSFYGSTPASIDNVGTTVEGVTYKGYNSVGIQKDYCKKDNTMLYSWDAKQVTTRCKAPDFEQVVTSGHTEDEDAIWEDVLEPHIVESDEGVQYWGRAIGNAQILSETGDSSSYDHVHEPNQNVEGSFVEYKINLSEPLFSVKLTANLIPARYLSRNDIWRAVGAANDWTPGYLLGEDGEMHLIEDWRHVLFIDGVQIPLDNTVDTKLIHSYSADWYSLPMDAINLSAGEHTIKMAMAGGYRHTFVRWGLETLPGEGIHTHAYGNLTTVASQTGATTAYQKSECTRNDGAMMVKWDSMDYTELSGSLKQGSGDDNLKLSSNGNFTKYTLNMNKKLKGKIFILGAMDYWGEGSQYLNTTMSTRRNGDEGTNFEISVNNETMTIDESQRTRPYGELIPTRDTDEYQLSEFTWIQLGDVELNAGLNEIQYTRIDSYNLWIKSFMIVGTSTNA